MYLRSTNLSVRNQQDYTLYDSIYIKFQKSQNYGGRSLICGCQGLKVKGDQLQRGMREMFYIRNQQTAIKVQIVSILGIAGHIVSVTTTQLCSHSTRTATDNIVKGYDCVKFLFLKIGRTDLAYGLQFADLCSIIYHYGSDYTTYICQILQIVILKLVNFYVNYTSIKLFFKSVSQGFNAQPNCPSNVKVIEKMF